VSREQIDRTVREVVGAVLRRTIAPGEQVRRSDEPGWDSLAHVNIVFAVEGELGIQLSAEELGELDTLDKLADAAEAHLRAEPPRAWP
jgi:acyl carrier protein